MTTETLPQRQRSSQQIVDDALRAEIRALLGACGVREESETFQRFLPPGKTLDQLGESRLRDLYGLCERTRIAKADQAASGEGQEDR